MLSTPSKAVVRPKRKHVTDVCKGDALLLTTLRRHSIHILDGHNHIEYVYKFFFK